MPATEAPVAGVPAAGVPIAKAPATSRVPPASASKRDKRAAARQTVKNETGFGNIKFSSAAFSHASAAAKHVPRCYTQALNSWDKWGPSTLAEFGSMHTEKVWKTPRSDISLIPKADIMPSMLLYDEKFHPDGTHNKYKCRLVGRGDLFAERFQTDNYSGTVKPESVRILLAVAAEKDLEIESVDVKTAFLNAKVEDGVIIYMRRPPGVPDHLMPEVVQLNKYIYGLPEASKKFREHSDRTLRSLDFKPTASDPCVYIKRSVSDGALVYVSVHVDDFGIMAPTKAHIDEVKQGLAKTYKLVCTPDLKFYLGLHITRDRVKRSIDIHQGGYIDEFLSEYNIIPSASTNFPHTPMVAVDSDTCTLDTKPLDVSPLLPPSKITFYQAKVGSLNYLAGNTRPDILFATTMASRRNQNPTGRDMEAVDRILWYVAGTRTLGLRLFSGEGIKLYCTVDAAYANHLDRKSHTGVTLHIGRHSGSFHSVSKKQSITADSSTVAEFIGTHIAAKEVMWARAFLKEIGFPQTGPTVMFEDNKSTIAMISNPGNGQKTKHIDVRYNFIREQVMRKAIAMQHLGTKDMTSDALTKGLSKVPFLYLRPKLLGMSATKVRHQIYQELRPLCNQKAMSVRKLRSIVYLTLSEGR